MNEFDIISVIRAACYKAGCKSFGHGPRSYENLTQENEALQKSNEQKDYQGIEFPRAWLHLVTVKTDLTISKNFNNNYMCLLDFHQLDSMDTNTKVITQVLNEVKEITSKFISEIIKNKEIKKVSNIVREPLYHVLDDNAHGYALAMTVNIEEDSFC